METIRRNWVAILLGILLLLGWYFYLTKPDVREDYNRLKTEMKTIVQKHKADSVHYVKNNDSLTSVIAELKGKVEYQKEKIIALKASHAVIRDSVANLPPVQAVQYFSQRTGATSTLTTRGVIVPMKAITQANIIFTQGDEAKAQVTSLEAMTVTQDSIINGQQNLLTIKDNRIVQLTNEYYKSQQVQNDLNKLIKKQRRSIRTKNAMVGILGGVAAGAVVVAILK